MSTNGVRVTSVMGKLDRTAFKLLKYSNIAKLVEKTRKTDNPQKIQEADIGRGFIGYPKGRNRDIKLVN